jgi:hypothetical protein
MKLTNLEFMLLQIVCEHTEVFNYGINCLLKERGYQEGIDIGTVSVNRALNHLSKQQLINFYTDSTQSGEIHPHRKLAITHEGKKLLWQEIINALSSSRERDDRFDIALAAIPLVAADDVVVALKNRKIFLAKVAEHIQAQFECQGGTALPFNLQALFRHSLLLIKHEIDFIDILLQEL